MTLLELDEIKSDIENGISYADIAVNRALAKAPLIAILHFEELLINKYKDLYQKELDFRIDDLVSNYEKDIKSLNDEILNLKAFNLNDEILNLKNEINDLKNKSSSLNREIINQGREVLRYENSFFSFLIR